MDRLIPRGTSLQTLSRVELRLRTSRAVLAFRWIYAQPSICSSRMSSGNSAGWGGGKKPQTCQEDVLYNLELRAKSFTGRLLGS